MGPSRSVAPPRLRAAAGLGVTLALTGALASGLVAVVEPLLAPTDRSPGLDDLLVLGCALVLVPAWCRLALGVVLCLGETLVHRSRSAPTPGLLRPALARRVAALVVGSSVGGLVGVAPVIADVAPEGATVPTALPLPLRPVGGLVTAAASPRPAASPPRDATVVVRPGDTLWSLASRHLVAPAAAGGAPDGQVDAAWRRLYAVNRAALGPDPDLIRPGTRLDLPAPAPTEGHP